MDYFVRHLVSGASKLPGDFNTQTNGSGLNDDLLAYMYAKSSKLIHTDNPQTPGSGVLRLLCSHNGKMIGNLHQLFFLVNDR